jgi:colicin import membrane protein
VAGAVFSHLPFVQAFEFKCLSIDQRKAAEAKAKADAKAAKALADAEAKAAKAKADAEAKKG